MDRKSHSGDEQKRSAAGDRGREGFGDDAGTRVGRPDPARGTERGAPEPGGQEHGGQKGAGRDRQQGAGRTDDGFSRGPSTRPVEEGLEGAVLDDDESDDRRRARSGETHAGSEAARGIHDANESAGGTRGGQSRRGSEPLEGRSHEHESNYGGKMGEPRKK